ncbi:MAG TPA: TolC family protein [Spirochaetes bacterium]|nr:TolC family protein [Spirochaetota bacterium]
MKKVKIILIMAFVFLTALNIAGAETFKLTLDEAIALALENSTVLKAKKLGTFSAQAGVKSARSAYFPAVSAGASYTHIFDDQKSSDMTITGFPTIPGSYYASSDPISLSADVNQVIYTFGMRKNSVLISEENVKLAGLDFEEEKRKLVIAVSRAFYGYILAKEVLVVEEETLSYKEEALDVARKRFEAGLSPDYEVLSSESDLENFKPGVISARNRVEFTLLAVMDLLGFDGDTSEFDVELTGVLEPEYYSFEKDKIIEQAIAVKYEVSQYKSNISMMSLQNNITKSLNKPSIAGFANYTLMSGFDSSTGDPRYWGEDSWDGVLTIGVSVRMPVSTLFPWGKVNADIKKGALDLEQLEMGLSSLENGISV